MNLPIHRILIVPTTEYSGQFKDYVVQPWISDREGFVDDPLQTLLMGLRRIVVPESASQILLVVILWVAVTVAIAQLFTSLWVRWEMLLGSVIVFAWAAWAIRYRLGHIKPDQTDKIQISPYIVKYVFGIERGRYVPRTTANRH